MKQQDTGSFTNHSGMVHYKGKDYFFYHTGWAKGGGGYNRSMAVEEMHFNADGTIQPITATRKGVKALCTMNPYLQQQAETLNAGLGISVVGNESDGVYVTDINASDSMRVANLDFGSEGAKSITLRVASASGKGTLVIRQDHARGKILAKIPVAATGGDDVWEERTVDLTSTPIGVHAVHFGFTGTSSPTLFNWDWWKFNEFTSEIEAVSDSADDSSAVFYTLQGVPVTNPGKGIYLKGGRKVLLR